MKSLAVLSSVPFESDRLLASLKNVRSIKVAGKKVFRGKLQGHDILLLNTGIGKVNAAHFATCVIENFHVKHIINIGVGGAYPGSGLHIGDIAIASKEIFGDEGVMTAKGWADMTEIGIPVVQIGKKKYFNEFPLDNGFAKKIVHLVTRHPLPVTRYSSPVTKSGTFLTVSSTSGTRKRAVELAKRFNAACENMEGAAIAQVCAIYKIPFLEIRGISNMVGERDKRKWDLQLASENCQGAVLEVIKNAF